MIVINGIEMDDGVDEPDQSWRDESALGPEGCCFPGRCCMPGPHYESECHTPEMLMAQETEAASAPNDKVGGQSGREGESDSRFFAGYIWCSDSQDCMVGLCIKAASRKEAAEKYAASRRRHWCKKRTVWTMLSASDKPTPVEA